MTTAVETVQREAAERDAKAKPKPPATKQSEELMLSIALVKAQKHAKAVEKGSRNEYHRYSYASAEAIIQEARDALAESGLSCPSLGWKLRFDDHWGLLIDVEYRLWHESGAFKDFAITTPVIPEKGRPLDKAVATALTYSRGYFLRDLLLLPRVDASEDADKRDDREHEPRQPRASGADHASREQRPYSSVGEKPKPVEQKDQPITKEQFMELSRLIDERQVDQAKFYEHYAITELKAMTQFNYEHARNILLLRPFREQPEQAAASAGGNNGR